MVRASKPYQRSDNYRKGDPDAAGGWKHDLHDQVKASLASRLSSSTSSSKSSSRAPAGGSLLARIAGGQGKELIPSSNTPKLHGFDGPLPANPSNLNAGLELLPSGGAGAGTRAVGKGMKSGPAGGRLVDRSGLDAALSRGNSGQNRGKRPRELLPPQPRQQAQAQVQAYAQPQGFAQQQQQQNVSIMGAARAQTWVRVENLAAGTTAEDVLSAFAHLPVLSAKPSPSSSSFSTVSIDIEMETRSAAEELIKTYDGVVADGNALRVTLVAQSLRDRLGGGGGSAVASTGRGNGVAGVGGGIGGAGGGSAGRELLGPPSSGKLYSDTILSTNSNASITTLSEQSRNTEIHRAQRSDAWIRGGPSLAQRLGRSGAAGSGSGGGGERGRGQIGGGSFHDILMN